MVQPLVVGLDVFGAEEVLLTTRHFNVAFVEERGEVVVKELIDLVISFEIGVLYTKEVGQHMVLNVQADLLLVGIFAPFELLWFGVVPSVDDEEGCDACKQERILYEVGSDRFLTSSHYVEQPGECTELLHVFCQFGILLSVVLKLLDGLFKFIVERDQEADLFKDVAELI